MGKGAAGETAREAFLGGGERLRVTPAGQSDGKDRLRVLHVLVLLPELVIPDPEGQLSDLPGPRLDELGERPRVRAAALGPQGAIFLPDIIVSGICPIEL
jgi:hypothetical protein